MQTLTANPLRAVGLALLFSSSLAIGQIKIVSLSRGGDIAWSGASPSDILCLQRSSSIDSEWQSVIGGQPVTLSATGTRATIPILESVNFYRIRKAGTSQIVDALTESKTVGLHSLAVRFDPPPGGGRAFGGGAVIFSDSSFDAFGSAWEFDYAGNDPSAGVQVIHPYKGGQCILSIKRDSVGLDAPKRWLEVGYGGGNTKAVTRTAAFSAIFPLQNATTYHFKTDVSPSGAISIVANGTVVASGNLSQVYPIDFSLTEFENFPGGRSTWDIRPFRGSGFPYQWQKGYTGLLLEPTDRAGGGFTGVFRATYAPGL